MDLTARQPDGSTPVPLLPLATAWARYEAIRDRLPTAVPRGPTRHEARLFDVAEDFDGFLFDSFGVLNVGDAAIPGAAACLDALRHMGKRIRVLTNAASYSADVALDKYRRMGLTLDLSEIVSSRAVTFAHLASVAPALRWGAIAAAGDSFADAAGADVFDLLAPGAAWDRAEGILFLSSARWTAALQDRLAADLAARPRPVVVGNPDLVAPREGGLSIEPGFWAHDLQDRTGVVPRLFGKPYPEAFATALSGIGPGRHAMIGDTLHTDILGGQAAGLATILVTDHGILAGRDIAPFIAASGIVPDIVLPAI
jgi:HAD superfamily hydrolase (TIGR01459 family)